MKNSIRERAKKVPQDTKIFVSLSMQTARQIAYILEQQGKTQRDLARLLNKRESEISKWLRGTHNFTYRTISKIEAAIGEPIILTARQSLENYAIYGAVVGEKSTLSIHVSENCKIENPININSSALIVRASSFRENETIEY